MTEDGMVHGRPLIDACAALLYRAHIQMQTTPHMPWCIENSGPCTCDLDATDTKIIAFFRDHPEHDPHKNGFFDAERAERLKGVAR